MVGARLALLLEQKNMRAGTLATRTGIPKATIYSILRRNTKNVDYDVLTKIAQELSVPVSYFLDGDSSEYAAPVADQREEEFLALFHLLTTEQQQFILDAMRGLLHK